MIRNFGQPGQLLRVIPFVLKRSTFKIYVVFDSGVTLKEGRHGLLGLLFHFAKKNF